MLLKESLKLLLKRRVAESWIGNLFFDGETLYRDESEGDKYGLVLSILVPVEYLTPEELKEIIVMAAIEGDPYYDLVEVTWKDGRTGHIPVPFFLDMEGGQGFEFISQIPVSFKIRDEKFFTCPECGERGFFAGLCGSCEEPGKEYKINLERRKRNLLKAVEEGKALPSTVVSVKYIVSQV